jgi:GTPase SAR1 family protein
MPIKIVVLGGKKVGKTEWIQSIKNQGINDVNNLNPSCAEASYEQTKFCFWDVPLNEKYNQSLGDYFKEAGAFVLLYDVNDRNSLNDLNGYIETINKDSKTVTPQIIFYGLISNKENAVESDIVRMPRDDVLNQFNSESMHHMVERGNKKNDRNKFLKLLDKLTSDDSEECESLIGVDEKNIDREKPNYLKRYLFSAILCLFGGGIITGDVIMFKSSRLSNFKSQHPSVPFDVAIIVGGVIFLVGAFILFNTMIKQCYDVNNVEDGLKNQL